MPAKILIIDDDPDIVEALSLILEANQYQVTSAHTRQMVASAIEKNRPDIILLDVLLSGLDGRDLSREMKQAPLTQSIPIIMMSAHPAAAKSIERCGADGFIAKPFEINELLRIIAIHSPKS